MDYHTGLYFIYFLNSVFSTPDWFYSVHLEKKAFSDAESYCESKDGVLANLISQDISEVLKVISSTVKDDQNKSPFFWIGLKKDKTCVQEDLPLKGFYWTVDKSTHFEPNKWRENPELTCTNALCGLLSVDYPVDHRWGLAAKSCKQKFAFICRHKELKSCSKPFILGTHDIKQRNYDPDTLELICNNSNFTLTCSRSTQKWNLKGGGEADISELCLECQKGYKRSDINGTCVDIDECNQPQICKYYCFNTPGSYHCMCEDDQSTFYNEDSEICKKQMDSDSTLSLFKPSSPSVKMSPPPVVPANKTSLKIEESTGDLSNILIPLIIALLIFIVLVVIIVAIVKYCLIRRARKRAKERSAACKESVALNGSDSMEKVNEKEAI